MTVTATYDLKEDMANYLLKEYSFTEDDTSLPAGTVQTNRAWFSWPYTFGDMNPLCLRTWYVLKDGNGEIEALTAQTWLSLIPQLPGINWVATKIFGDLKYTADYTVWNGAGQQIGEIDGRMISLGIEFDILDREGIEAASARIGDDLKRVNIYRGNTSGKIGEIKIDSETLERGDYELSFEEGAVDTRVMKLFTAVTVNQALINLEETGA